MRKLLTSGFCVLLTILSGRAQGPEEAEFLAAAADEMNEYARLCLRSGFPRRAREVWLEVISEYDVNNTPARTNLGFSRVGASWSMRPGFSYPDQDRPHATSARNLQRRWDSLTETLGDGHRELAARLRELDLRGRSDYHFNRTLRFLPGDPDAVEALGLDSFEGFYGTPDEIALLRRSRLMERAVIRLGAKSYDVEVLPAGRSHPWLSSVPHHGVKSENFTLWGDLDVEVLQEAAAYCERALEFCDEAFAEYPEFPAERGVVKTLVFFETLDTWKVAIEANRHRLGSLADFTLEYAHSTTLGHGSQAIHVSGHEGVATVYDMAVRWVAQDYAGFKTDGLREGIGHAIVGMFFGRNLVFGLAPEEEAFTVSGEQEREPLMPDLATWGEQARESAWQRNSVAAGELPLIKGAKFPDDARIKAWSFSDYLLRRHPTLLLALDKTGDGAQHRRQVEQMFQESADMSLLDLDEAWRQFWTEDTPINREVHNQSSPLEAVSSAAPAWLEAFNEIRVSHGSPAVGWSAELSVACKQHAEYLDANRNQRGMGWENTQVPGAEGFSSAGRSFAETAIVSTRGTNPRTVMEDWIDLPGYRNNLLDENLHTIGLFVDGQIAVLEVKRGRRRTERSAIQFYPNETNLEQNPAPRSIDVKFLGPAMETLMRRHGGRRRPQIGYPISIHFYRARPERVQCTVSAGGELLEGFLHRAHDSGDRRIGASGMWVFYPLEPLRRGVEIRVAWSYVVASGEREQFEYLFFAN